MVRVELFQINSKCTFIILFGLLQVTQVSSCEHLVTKVICRCTLNSKCTFIILFGLLQVTQGNYQSYCSTLKMVRVELFQTNSKCRVAVNSTKVIVARCHIKMVRVELFQIE